MQAVIDTAIRACQGEPLEPGTVYAFHTPAGIERVDLTGPEYTGVLERKRGTVTVQDVDSFLAYWDKHNEPGSDIYARPDRLTVTAVLDAHSATEAGWGQHRLHLQLTPTPAWQAWKALSGQWVGQEQMAEFLEDHLPEIVEPSGADMLELAQTIQATIKADFKSSSLLANGARTLAYAEEIDTRAGRKGELTIPGQLALGIEPFEGSGAYRVTARFRTRIQDGHLRLAVKLDRPEDVVKAAFTDVRQAIAEADSVRVPVLLGTPIA